MHSDRLRALIDWLIDGAPPEPIPTVMLTRTCERLLEAGVPLSRVAIFVETLHPDIYGRSFIWRPGETAVANARTEDVEQLDVYQRSPLKILYDTGTEVRFRMDDPASLAFPFFDDVRAEGVTDYLALPLLFLDGNIHAVSFTTKADGGFTDPHLNALRAIAAPLARLIEIIGLRRTAATLLDTYVGNRAGARILAGQIRRGHTELLRVAIWLSDLRGYTALSDRLPPDLMVRVLNAYFDCQVGPILRAGGEVLKFMGDGLLAVFPMADDGSDAADVCARMLTAVDEARTQVRAMSYAEGNHVVDNLRFGVALHVGQVLYGNIGGGNRLDFTCVGPAVNLAARMEKIAGRLGRTAVASADFIQHCADHWTDLGDFTIAGLSHTERVFGLSAEDPQGAEGL
ncbi:adenylate/guanylate cyclase domain-containing protein [Rhodopseudomonas sp. B29]|uniref:adenylate/guanylate cyclase domain-containing protein n=1 Tax=Rhodopseudomonas sp. B29 TaxID=95607 RepID=UPI000348BEAA|nr:adenylate/guanylate cyclase domain-containing protein [Rhodopseudomonas sp. B29]